MALSPEQLEAILALSDSDIGGMEDDQTRQQALADSLRSRMTGTVRKGDIGSNIANGAFGIAAAMNDYKAQQATPQIGAAKKSVFGDLLRNLQRKKELYPAGNNPDEQITSY